MKVCNKAMHLALCNNLAQLSWNIGDPNAFAKLDTMFADGEKIEKEEEEKETSYRKWTWRDRSSASTVWKFFKVSIQIDNFISPEYINMNFIVIGLSPHIMKQSTMKTFSMKIQIVTRKPRRKRRNINVNKAKKKRNRNQVTKTRWRVRVSNTRRKVTRRKRSIRIGNLCLYLFAIIVLGNKLSNIFQLQGT